MSSLSDSLEADLSWREAELASLKLLAAREDKQSVRYRSLLRALWCLLYAHYEGFFKFAWDLYLQSLAGLTIPRSLVIDELARFSLKKPFRVMKGNLSDDTLWQCYTSDFHLWMAEALTFELMLETQSNLWPSVARENHEAVGLPYKEIDDHEIQLKALVSRRNDIAHGKPMVIQSLSDYQQYEDAAMRAMHELALAVLDILESGSYLRAGSTLGIVASLATPAANFPKAEE